MALSSVPFWPTARVGSCGPAVVDVHSSEAGTVIGLLAALSLQLAPAPARPPALESGLTGLLPATPRQ